MTGARPGGDAVADGHHHKKQLGSRVPIVAWSHGARFQQGVRLAGVHSEGKLLDYGCGDGTFLSFVAEYFAACVGADVALDEVADCQRRLGTTPTLRFCSVRDLEGAEHTHAYEVVTYMETLEHCPESAVERVLEDLARLVAPGGTILISVPIETGPAFLLKHVARKITAWRGLEEYKTYEAYSIGDAVRMLFAGPATEVQRPVYGEPGHPMLSHYGFNWRRLRRRIERSFRVEKTLFSPLRFSRGWLSSQAWFVCRPLNAATGRRRT